MDLPLLTGTGRCVCQGPRTRQHGQLYYLQVCLQAAKDRFQGPNLLGQRELLQLVRAACQA